jgi:hypothetical protein
MLVRVQNGIDGVRGGPDGKPGSIELGRKEAGREATMNTFHFSLNGAVANHAYGKQFDSAPFVIIASLQATCAKGLGNPGNRPSGLSPADTWFHADDKGKMLLADALLLAPEGVFVDPSLAASVRRYPAGASKEEGLANRNQAIAAIFNERNLPLRQVTTNNWAGVGLNEISSPAHQQAMVALGGPAGYQHNSHMNGPEEQFARTQTALDFALARISQGERLDRDDMGRDRPLIGVADRLLSELREQIVEQHKAGADPRALAFYLKTLKVSAQQHEVIVGLAKVRENSE